MNGQKLMVDKFGYCSCPKWNELWLSFFHFLIVDTTEPAPHFPLPPTSPPAFTCCCLWPWAVHTCIYVLWLFSSSLLHPRPSEICQSVPCVHASGFILFISIFYSLDSTYKSDHTVFFFLWLAYFTQHHMRWAHPSVTKGRSSFFLYSRKELHCVNVSKLFFIHFSTDGHLGCFQTLAIVNNCAFHTMRCTCWA